MLKILNGVCWVGINIYRIGALRYPRGPVSIAVINHEGGAYFFIFFLISDARDACCSGDIIFMASDPAVLLYRILPFDASV